MLVSVLINNYNYANYIAQCIESVLNQTYKNIEIIVYDDGSTDSSLNILSQYNKVKVLTAENYGKTHNLNQMNAVYQAFIHSKGEIIVLLDSDDFFKINKIERVIEAFQEHQNIDVIQHTLEGVNKAGISMQTKIPVIKEVDNYKSYIYETNSLSHLFSMTSALSFRREFLEKFLPLEEDELNFLCVDTRLMIISSMYTKILTLKNPLTYYRIHGNNAWGKLGDPDIHKVYTEQLYSFFNRVATKLNYPNIDYSTRNFLEHTFFYNDIDVEKCTEFIGHDKFWIWGAGEAGQSICHALSSLGDIMIGFVDSDERKQGQTILDSNVCSPDQLHLQTSYKILISPYHAYDTIKSTLLEKGLIEGVHFIDPYLRESR